MNEYENSTMVVINKRAVQSRFENIKGNSFLFNLLEKQIYGSTGIYP